MEEQLCQIWEFKLNFNSTQSPTLFRAGCDKYPCEKGKSCAFNQQLNDGWYNTKSINTTYTILSKISINTTNLYSDIDTIMWLIKCQFSKAGELVSARMNNIQPKIVSMFLFLSHHLTWLVVCIIRCITLFDFIMWSILIVVWYQCFVKSMLSSLQLWIFVDMI